VVSPVGNDPPEPPQTHPLKYTKEFILSLYQESPIEKGRILEEVFSEESLQPVNTLPLTEIEKHIRASGAFNSESNKRGGRSNRGRGKGMH
jgi:hypothetical protein